MNESNNVVGLKAIVIGDSGVGKTSILTYIYDQDRIFDPHHQPTVGTDFISYSPKNKGETQLYFWDTAGQEIYKAITRPYYRNSSCILLVYDITKRSSFDNLNNWLTDAIENAPTNANKFLVGNKSDLENERQISNEEGEKFALLHEMIFKETSAKNGKNVLDLANECYEKCIQGRELEKDPDTSTPVILSHTESAAASTSCYCCQ